LINPARNQCYNPRRLRMEVCSKDLDNRNDQYLLMSKDYELILNDIDTCVEAPLSSSPGKLTK